MTSATVYVFDTVCPSVSHLCLVVGLDPSASVFLDFKEVSIPLSTVPAVSLIPSDQCGEWAPLCLSQSAFVYLFLWDNSASERGKELAHDATV